MQETTWWLEHGDSSEVLHGLPTASVDALITDPPAGISFMGKAWDGAKGGRDKWIAWLVGILSECRRVMKPGAYGWVWALPRTAHWTATACEDAGFAVRDVLVHVFGTGFPKSRSLLKPAAEHWILIKAPGDLRELRIDVCRIAGIKPQVIQGINSNPSSYAVTKQRQLSGDPNEGRWPANFALTHAESCTPLGNESWQCVEGCPVKVLDEQSGVSKSTGGEPASKEAQGLHMFKPSIGKTTGGLGDSGASRFFYTAKPSTKERSAGMPAGTKNTHVTVKATSLMRHLVRLVAAPGDLVLDPFAGSGTTGIAAVKEECRFVGIEKEVEHIEIAAQRIAFATADNS